MMNHSMDDVFQLFDNPHEAWNCGAMRNILASETEDWLIKVKRWKVFVTLTFRDPVSPERAKSMFRLLVRTLNKSA